MWESQPCWVTRISGLPLAQQRRAPRHGRRAASRRRAVPGGSATLTAVPLASGSAQVVREAGPREEHLAALVQRDRQHPGVVPEDPLHPVAVVGVDVDVGHPLRALVEQPADADRDVVVDAEAADPVRHRVVQAAGDVGAVHALARPDLPHRLDGGAGDVGGRLVHVREDGVVVAAEPVRRVVGPRVPAGRTAPPRSARPSARWPARRRTATGAGTTRSPSSTPRSAASRIVRSTRSGDIGWSWPEVVLGQGAVEDDRRRSAPCLHGPDASTLGPCSRRTSPRGGPPDRRTTIEHTHRHGRPRAAVVHFRTRSGAAGGPPGA